MRSPIDTLLNLANTDGLPPLPNTPEHQTIWDTTMGWHPDDAQAQKFQHLYHAVLQGNRAFNLTRITEPEDFWEKHLWDSMSGIRGFLNAESDDTGGVDKADSEQSMPTQPSQSMAESPLEVIDIGTGAGFPGLPVAIACPAWHITLLDATRKKTTFLDAVIAALSLPNVVTLTERAESAGKMPGHRERYDLALLRAVAPASVCAEYAMPLLKVDGWAVLYRGHWTDDDTDALLPALDLLGAELELVDDITTPMSKSDRHCIILRKAAPTPRDFPRSVGTATKDPL